VLQTIRSKLSNYSFGLKTAFRFFLPGRQAFKEFMEFCYYAKFYDEFTEDPDRPWCGDHARRMIREELLSACPDLDERMRGKSVLDFGSGCTGALRAFPTPALKIEMDPLMDRYLAAQKSTPRRTSGTVLLKGHGENIPLSDDFIDVVVSRNSLDHVDRLPRVVEEIRRVLKPGGLLVLVTDLKDRATYCEPSAISSAQAIRSLFAGFEVEFEEIRDIPSYAKLLKTREPERPTYYGRLRKTNLSGGR